MFAMVLATFGLLTSTTHVLPNGAVITITSSGKPSQDARVWSCNSPTFGSEHPSMTCTETGVTFTNPGGKDPGSASWSGFKRSFYEGEKVTISLRCNNMSVNFSGDGCADGKPFFSRGVRHPWTPDASSRTFEFTFQPAKGRQRVAMLLYIQSTSSGPYAGKHAGASWYFTPGPLKDAPTASLTAADAQQVSAGYLMRGSPTGDFSDVSNIVKNAPQPTGIAADGSSLLVLRAPTTKADSATFTVGGAGGALYPLTGETPVKSAGTRTLRVQTKESGGKHWALALYRPPSYFGRGNTSKPLDFGVTFGSGAKANLALKLVPPPIVLVHGTYDNPKFCYEDHADEDDTALNMAPQLRNLGYEVWCTDWEETNGNKDPSEFQHNRMTVWRNPGGIKEALEATRRKGIVVSQADVICHSQGGAITRTYVRGFPFSVSMPPTHPHYTDPSRCKSGGELCWYHRADNYFLGDIHRLITISTTHRGSHVLNVFKGLAAYPDRTAAEVIEKALVNVFLYGIDKAVSGITTGGVKNQIPDSLELQLIGPSPVPSHAIACVASDEDMRNQRPDSMGEVFKGSELGMGNYWNKFYKVWLGTSDKARDFLFVGLCKLAGENGMPNPDAELARYRELASKVTINEDAKNVRMDALIFQMRKIVFQGLENDCTVGIKSSFGGLGEPFRTRIPNVLHGWAPRYRAVQLRVLQLLVGDGSDFDSDGFPGYSGIKSKASTFAVVIPPLDPGPPVSETVIPNNPGGKKPPVVGNGEGTGGGAPPFSSETLSSPESWKDASGFGGTAKFEDGRLHLSSPNAPEAEANTFLKNPLRGDFDLIFDYSLDSWKAKGEGEVQFAIMLSPAPKTAGQDYILLGRRTTSEGEVVTVAPWNEMPGEEVKAATLGGGKLRVSRKSAIWTVSQWNGQAWSKVLSFGSEDHPEVYLGFGLSTGGEAENAKVSVKIESG